MSTHSFIKLLSAFASTQMKILDLQLYLQLLKTMQQLSPCRRLSSLCVCSVMIHPPLFTHSRVLVIISVVRGAAEVTGLFPQTRIQIDTQIQSTRIVMANNRNWAPDLSFCQKNMPLLAKILPFSLFPTFRTQVQFPSHSSQASGCGSSVRKNGKGVISFFFCEKKFCSKTSNLLPPVTQKHLFPNRSVFFSMPLTFNSNVTKLLSTLRSSVLFNNFLSLDSLSTKRKLQCELKRNVT